jgi:hypothetical protein
MAECRQQIRWDGSMFEKGVLGVEGKDPSQRISVQMKNDVSDRLRRMVRDSAGIRSICCHECHCVMANVATCSHVIADRLVFRLRSRLTHNVRC